ncbi:DUF1266 domain-containing protein [Cohnella terricola]|uniref:DUF1266 domain-containing protein n=1 Tax=Cohnella terricola TaxID=1289167 RepID=A0A559JQ98_9BACL|nr:DUF1266 domain-containing protein [Cohnella terricola]TVY02062.1 DUF1266 domain-containing protein [Cohnella terricola]
MDYYNLEVRQQLSLYIHALSSFCLKGHNPYPFAKNMHLIFENKSRLSQMLDQWEIDDSEKLKEKLDWFFQTGHRKEFRDSSMLLSGLSISERTAFIQSLPDGDPRTAKLIVSNHYFTRLPGEGIAAYDHSWCVYACCAGYELGYLTEEDKWRMVAVCVREARIAYSSWKDYAIGYAAGADFTESSSSLEYVNKNQDYLIKLLIAPDSPLRHISLSY